MKTMPDTDAFLVKRLLAGDEAAFRTFFDTYFDRLFRFALRRLNGDREATRDVVQQTLIRAVERIGSWRAEAQLYTWLCTLCRHEVADFLRRESRHRGNVELLEDTPQVRSALESLDVNETGNPVAQCTRQERLGRLQVALDQLPPRYGDALEWKYVYGYTTAEIARRFGVGSEAAQSLLARARRAFHDIWMTFDDADRERALIGGKRRS